MSHANRQQLPSEPAEDTSTIADWARYTRLRHEFEAAYPGATPEQHQAAMRELARLCGV